jgi:hypothetical protein
MRGTMWLIALGCGILLSSSGCCGFLGHGCCGGGCGCESCGPCEGDCGPACGPVRRPFRERVCADDCGGCGSCGPRGGCGACGGCGGCGSCGGCCDECGGCCQGNFCFHPLRWLGGLFYTENWCGNGCCGEAICDQPGCHEPCDHCGHWTGPGGCASCNHGGAYEGGVYEDGEMSRVPNRAPLRDSPVMVPTPAGKAPAKATRLAPTYSYER